MKTPEEIIHEVIGIKPGAKPLTPMDYLECKKCLEYASQFSNVSPESPSKESKETFSEEDMRKAYEAGNSIGWCKIHSTFDEWIKTYNPPKP